MINETLEHRLRMLAIPVLEDGVVSLGETTLLLRAVRPIEQTALHYRKTARI